MTEVAVDARVEFVTLELLVDIVVEGASVCSVGSSNWLVEFVEIEVDERKGSEEDAVIDATAFGDAAASS